MLELNLSNSMDSTLREQLTSNFKIIDKALYGSQGVTQEQFNDAMQGLRNIAYTISAGSDKGESNVEVQTARTNINGHQYVSVGARMDAIEREIKRLGGTIDV
ncbi:hypothetical protein ABU186_01740 [Weissella paramesenteroides]